MLPISSYCRQAADPAPWRSMGGDRRLSSLQAVAGGGDPGVHSPQASAPTLILAVCLDGLIEPTGLKETTDGQRSEWRRDRTPSESGWAGHLTPLTGGENGRVGPGVLDLGAMQLDTRPSRGQGSAHSIRVNTRNYRSLRVLDDPRHGVPCELGQHTALRHDQSSTPWVQPPGRASAHRSPGGSISVAPFSSAGSVRSWRRGDQDTHGGIRQAPPRAVATQPIVTSMSNT
jgi:hypothetical protein